MHPDHRDALEAELLASYRLSHRPRRWMMLVNPQNQVTRWALGTSLLALSCIGACEVPTSYQVEMGKQLEIQMQAEAVAASPAALMQSLQEVDGVDDVSVSVNNDPDGASLLVAAWGHDLDAEALLARLRQSDPALASASVQVRPLEGTVHGKLGDRLGKALFDLEVSGETADDIRAEILAQLAAQGFQGDAQVDVQTDGDARTITIQTTTSDAAGDPGATEDVQVQKQ
jgi:hypothetical protein